MRELTKEEKSAIRRLKRLLKGWPKTLAIVAIDCSLSVYDADKDGQARMKKESIGWNSPLDVIDSEAEIEPLGFQIDVADGEH